MAFRVGQKVICVDDANQDWTPGETDVRRGKIYTIRSVNCFKQPGLYLVEINNPPMLTDSGFIERDFLQRRFRPIVERKTDISIFTRMLTSKPVEVE